jgi:large subunit ribosomal protein L15
MFAVRFAGINLDVLEALSANYGEINRDILVENGIIKPKETLIKILGDGKLTRAIRVVANKFSKNARQKIEAEGGVAIEVASKG